MRVRYDLASYELLICSGTRLFLTCIRKNYIIENASGFADALLFCIIHCKYQPPAAGRGVQPHAGLTEAVPRHRAMAPAYGTIC